MTLKQLKHAVEVTCNLDFSYTKTGSFSYEYRINLRIKDGGTEATSYYTDDREDAFQTALRIAAERDSKRTREERSRHEHRAQELMFNPTDKALYLHLLCEGQRTEYHVICPECHTHVQTYESDIIKHLRTCTALRLHEDVAAAIEAQDYGFEPHDLLQIKRHGLWDDFCTLMTPEQAHVACHNVMQTIVPVGTDTSMAFRIRRVVDGKEVTVFHRVEV